MPIESGRTRVMEAVTQWTARRTYPEMLQAIGNHPPLHQAEIIKRGYGYRVAVPQFDQLLAALNLGDDLLEDFRALQRTKKQSAYFEEVASLLSRESGKSRSQIIEILKVLNYSEFENQLKML